MLSLKEMWSPSRIRAEANSIENHLFNTTQRLKRLEGQYRSKKMHHSKVKALGRTVQIQENGVSGED